MIPQVKTEEQVREVLRIISSVLHPSNGSVWEIVEEYPGGLLATAFTGEGETVIEAVNDAIKREWNNLTPAQQAAIRSICGGEG